MNKSILYFLIFSLIATTWTACTSDDDIPPICDCRGPEIAVDVALLTPTDSLVFSYRTTDSTGRVDTVIIGGSLAPYTTYTFTTTFYDELTRPIEDITEDIEIEGVDHFVIYESGTLDFNIMRLDSDDDGNPIGLTGTMTTGDAGSGEFQVILRHEPTKTANAATGGETDVDVSFPVTVE